MTRSEFAKEVAAVQKALDDSTDTAGAIRQILLAVYLLGVKKGAFEGYAYGHKDGRAGQRAVAADRRAAAVVSVHYDATRHALGELRAAGDGKAASS